MQAIKSRHVCVSQVGCTSQGKFVGLAVSARGCLFGLWFYTGWVANQILDTIRVQVSDLGSRECVAELGRFEGLEPGWVPCE